MNHKKEQEFIKNYDITQYERPSVAADIVIFTVMEEEEDNYRKLPTQHLNLLLIKRGEYPFKGMWALPGGFLRPGETVDDSAKRELFEETNVSEAHLEQMHVFSEIGRDPRGWIISNSYMALVDSKQLSIKGADDATDAKWFQVNFKLVKEEKVYGERVVTLKSIFEITLTHKNINLKAMVLETKEMANFTESISYEMLSHDDLAFDHAKIITYAIRHLRHEVNKSDIAFDLLPEYFTLTELQRVHEVILDKELLTANFRRKIAGKVEETNKTVEGAGHRPSKLYRHKLG